MNLRLIKGINPTRDLPKLSKLLHYSMTEPETDKKLFRLFHRYNPNMSPGQIQEANAELAERFVGAYQDPHSTWLKVTDEDTKEIVGAAIWKFYHEPPFSQPEAMEATWYPPGGARDFVSQALQAFDAPHQKLFNVPHAFIWLMYTHPQYQMSGVGKTMMKWGLDQADALGYDVWADCFPSSRKFARRLGFEELFQNNIRPETDHPDEAWKQLEKELLPLVSYPMRRRFIKEKKGLGSKSTG